MNECDAYSFGTISLKDNTMDSSDNLSAEKFDADYLRGMVDPGDPSDTNYHAMKKICDILNKALDEKDYKKVKNVFAVIEASARKGGSVPMAAIARVGSDYAAKWIDEDSK